MGGVFTFKPGLYGRLVECRVGRDEVELFRDQRLLRRLAYADVASVQWVEMYDEYRGQARRSLMLKGRSGRLHLLQKDGFHAGPVPVTPFYEACAATLGALAAARPDVAVYFGSRGWARWLYAFLMLPTAVIAVMLIASAFQYGLAGGLVLAALGASFLTTAVLWVRGWRLNRATPQWTAADLAAEMRRWASDKAA